MSIVYYPEESLSLPCEKIDFNKTSKEELLKLYDRLYKNMIEFEGIGIAANQIGEQHNACLIYSQNVKDNFLFLLNPEIVRHGKDKVQYNEGCLSFPSINIEKSRHKIVTVKYQDIEGIEKEIVLKGIDSVCVQHEIDHLNGVTFIDDLNSEEKDEIQSKIKNFIDKKRNLKI